MPTYDYKCRSCGTTTEVIHSMLEEGPTTCERCGGELKRVFFPAGIIFKGSGFYKTDSRASGSKPTSAPAATGTGDGASPTADTPSGASADSSGSGDTSSGAGSTPAKAADAGKGSVTKESAGT